MATKQFNSRIQWKKDTSANWTANNPVLLNGEIAIVVTNAGETRFKVGDGTSSYTALPFQDEFLQDAITEVDNALLTHETDTSNPHVVTKSQVGLGNVDNIKQYSVSNPPPYPVTSVNGDVGAVVLAASDVGAVPNSRTVNGKPLSSNITLNASDIGLGNVDNVQQYSASNPPPYPVTSVNSKTGAVSLTYSDVNAVPTSRTVNGKALSSNITLNYDDVGARPDTWVPTLNNLGITATASELNKLDGATVTTQEINYLDGVSSSIQTQLNGKVPTSRTINGQALTRNITLDASDVGALSTAGGTLTGNLTGKYLTGTWLQTTAATDLNSTATKIAVLDSSGWVYYRTANEILKDIGVPSAIQAAIGDAIAASY